MPGVFLHHLGDDIHFSTRRPERFLTGVSAAVLEGLREILTPSRRRRTQPPKAWSAMVEAVAAREAAVKRLADDELRRGAEELRSRSPEAGSAVAEGAGDFLVDGFALAREAAARTLGMRPYDVQIQAGIALHEGRVVEMQTGEGKTLAGVAPVFLAALIGRGAHVLTFNDYLARRDAGWMRPAYELLGLSVGHIQEGMSPAERKAAYARDVTYVTAKEAGFDLLRDHLCLDPADQVHRPFHFALVDEADSILIDEARIPLVIAGETGESQGSLGRLADLARRLRRGEDFKTDEHDRNIFLIERGARRVEEALGCGDLYGDVNLALLAEIRNALHAEVLLHRDVDYIVRRGTVELVDEFTGRVSERRRWPDGLQAAVEAKEGLRLQDEGTILGSISLQHFLGLYPRLAGMTGTALPAADELEEIYGLEAVRIPTHRPCVRVDHRDVVFTSRRAKEDAVVEEVSRVHAIGRPILVGTVTVRESEALVARLRERGVACHVLNAKNDEQEAAIVSEAGARGAVTISTNMAGRGTDIRLGAGDADREREVVALGGLYVIGTNRHESRRIDDQLRGRAGRQGDPGSSRFFISLEDDLLARYGIAHLVPKRLLPSGHDGRIDHPVIHREVARAQRIVEGESFDIRKRLSEYSSLVEQQRELFVEWRQEALEDPESLSLLRRRAPQRWEALRRRGGEPLLLAIQQRLTLVLLDRCWSEHLAELQRVQDEVHLAALDGRMPLAEFARFARGAFETLMERVDDEIVERFETLSVGTDGIDWDAEGLRGPSATWTYLVSDNVFGNNLFLTLGVRPSFFLGAWALWPVLFLWAIYEHWKRRRKKPKKEMLD